MIAINDNYADGRDMSWLWDVDFESLRDDGVAMVSGMRAYDMALRLQYDEVPVSQVEPNLSRAVRQFIAENSQAPKHIFCTYTAMMHIRRELAKITDVERVK
jgi:UDP-N-acetylmuramyl tripeptide synthase